MVDPDRHQSEEQARLECWRWFESGQQRHGTSGRMQGANQHHRDDRGTHGDADRPGGGKNLDSQERDKCRRDVADDGRPRLGERRVRNAEHQDSRRPQGGDEIKGRRAQPDAKAYHKRTEADPDQSADAGTQLLAAVEDRQSRVKMVPCSHVGNLLKRPEIGRFVGLMPRYSTELKLIWQKTAYRDNKR